MTRNIYMLKLLRVPTLFNSLFPKEFDKDISLGFGKCYSVGTLFFGSFSYFLPLLYVPMYWGEIKSELFELINNFMQGQWHYIFTCNHLNISTLEKCIKLVTGMIKLGNLFLKIIHGTSLGSINFNQRYIFHLSNSYYVFGTPLNTLDH